MSQSVMTIVGGTVVDVVGYCIDEDLAVGQKNRMHSSAIDLIGGGGANAAMAAGFLSELFGSANRVRLVTSVGVGPNSDLARRDFERNGVDLLNATPNRQDDIERNIVLVNPGQRTPGVYSAESQDTYDPDILKDAAKTDILHIHGSMSSLSYQVAGYMSSASPCSVILDTSSYNEDMLGKLIGVSTHALFPDELADLPVSGFNGKPDWHAVMNYLDGFSSLSVRGVICGGEPAHIDDASSSYYTLDVPQVKMLDNLGAGDTLRGALVFALSLMNSHVGNDFKMAMEFAMAVASYSCQTRGRQWQDDLRADLSSLERVTGYNPNKMFDYVASTQNYDVHPVLNTASLEA